MTNADYANWFEQIRAQLSRLVPHPPAAPAATRTLGLVLGGGGGKGAAHLGVIQVLHDLRVPIDLIVGTSAGGAVAVLYAAGVPLDDIRELFRSTDLRRIFVPDPTRTGLVGQRRREELLTALLGDRTFADLSTRCAVTATDLVTGQIVLLDEGPLVPAVLATTALPSIFPPVLLDDKVLVDGGVLNNVPVDVAKAMGADRVIAVELNDAVAEFSLAPAEAANPLARLMLAPQQFTIANRALSLLVNHATALHLSQHPPELLIRPNVCDIPTLDMSNPEKGQQVGVAAAREAAAEILAVRAWRLDEPAPEAHAVAIAAAALAQIEPLPPLAPADSCDEEVEQIKEAAEEAQGWPRLPFPLPWWGSGDQQATRPDR